MMASLHSAYRMGPRHRDETREKQQHAEQAIADDAHGSEVVVMTSHCSHRGDRLARALTQLDRETVSIKAQNVTLAINPGARDER